MKNMMKNKKGITLISLVVTIIILLILAGISIGMLSGDNSILKQAGNAKSQTDIAEEKEILQTASLAAMGKSKYGDITKEKLDSELNKYPEIESTEQTDKGIVVTFKSNRAYLVNSDGDVSSYSDITIGNLVVKDGNTILAENCKSVQLGKALTISFDASIANGQITSITPNIAYTTAGEKSKTFTIVGKTSEGKEITKEYIVNLKGYYSIPEIQVGDFVQYDVEYQDMWNTSLNYSAINGWRLLNATKNDDGTYSNVELISTGIPARLYYHNNGTNNDWWQKTDSELTSFKNLLTDNGTNEYIFYTGTDTYEGLQASAGMYNNLGNITFRYGTDKSTYYNQGYYMYIKNGNNVYNNSQNLTTQVGNNLFKIGNVKIRTLTLPEINKKLGRKETSDTSKYDIDATNDISVAEDSKAIFRLDKINTILTGYSYSSSNYYWLASTVNVDGRFFKTMIKSVFYGGGISHDSDASNGIRPVITFLDSNVTFDISNDGKYFIIE